MLGHDLVAVHCRYLEPGHVVLRSLSGCR
jgi:hypothetical protein